MSVAARVAEEMHKKLGNEVKLILLVLTSVLRCQLLMIWGWRESRSCPKELDLFYCNYNMFIYDCVFRLVTVLGLKIAHQRGQLSNT